MTTEGNKEVVMFMMFMMFYYVFRLFWRHIRKSQSDKKKSFLLFKEKEKKRERGKQDSFVQPHATRQTPHATINHHTHMIFLIIISSRHQLRNTQNRHNYHSNIQHLKQ